MATTRIPVVFGSRASKQVNQKSQNAKDYSRISRQWIEKVEGFVRHHLVNYSESEAPEQDERDEELMNSRAEDAYSDEDESEHSPQLQSPMPPRVMTISNQPNSYTSRNDARSYSLPSSEHTGISYSFVDFVRQRKYGQTKYSYSCINRDYGSQQMIKNHLYKEHIIKMTSVNKIFCSEWLSEEQIVMGTKCNKLLLYNVSSQRLDHIPPLKGSESVTPISEQCGIHGLEINPSKSLLATGGQNSNDIAVYRLPTLDPLCMGEQAHSDWIFDICWLDDQFLISASRDKTLALWRIDDSVNKYCDLLSYGFINPLCKKRCYGADKVRAIIFNPNYLEVVALSLNAKLHVWDAMSFKQIMSQKLEMTQENVCLAKNDSCSMYAVGSKSHATLIDPRTLQSISKIDIQRLGPSVRSISFRGNLLTLGTGNGDILFFDVKAGKHLEGSCRRILPTSAFLTKHPIRSLFQHGGNIENLHDDSQVGYVIANVDLDEMNQLCRVCGEPAAGFHFGAFTCEGCKSFFGRTCNNVTSLGDCKTGGICVITRKNRTACKSCRLRKCLVVGMSKSGSRYGRRSNWFKIHCLLQDQPNQDSELSPEKAKMLIEELKGAKSKSGDVKEETSDNEENCSSSPTVTSSEIQDSNETHQFPILNWLHQTGQVPPETIPFLSAISPLIITHGLGIQTNNPTAQLANLSQYYPYLLSLMSSGAFQDDPAKPNPSSPTAFANGNDRCHPFYQTALHFKRDLQLPNPRNLTPTSSNSDDVEVTCHDESYLISQECRRLGEVPSDILPTGKLEGGNRIAPKQEIPKLKALFIDRMKRSLSPVDTDSSFKRRRRKSSLSEDELEVKIKEKSHLLQETNRNHRKSSEQCSGNVNSVQEQIEPIDLSIKTCSVNSKNNCTLTTPDNDSICSNVLACSMTLTPLTNFPSFHLSTNNLDEQKVLSSDPPEEQSSSVTSAIDLSC